MRKYFGEVDLHNTPVRRAIAMYGRSSLVGQIKALFQGDPKRGEPTFIEFLAPLVQGFHLADHEMGKQFMLRGLYRLLVQRIWSVLGSGASNDDTVTASYYGITPGWM